MVVTVEKCIQRALHRNHFIVKWFKLQEQKRNDAIAIDLVLRIRAIVDAWPRPPNTSQQTTAVALLMNTMHQNK